jgi:hypothetical protein
MTTRDQLEKDERERRRGDANRDPITGAAGSHPVGTGVGATGGAAAGAALGAIGGPVGAGIGLVAGAVAGGLAGKAIAEAIDPTVEDAYWEQNYSTRPYVDPAIPFDSYRPAYAAGYLGRTRYPDQTFDQAERNLRRDFDEMKSDSRLTWESAREATRDAWHRVEEALPGDADRDGR